MNLKKIVSLLAGGIGLGLSTWPFIEARWPHLKHEYITIPSDNPWQLTILHISDLHMWKGKQWVVRYLAKLTALQPDIVALTGDNFAEAAGLADLKAALEPLMRHPGIFCYGSNDYYSGVPKLPFKYFFSKAISEKNQNHTDKRKPDLPTDSLTDWLECKGWLNLNNKSASLNLGISNKLEVKLAFTGVDDPHINRDECLKFPSGWLDADLRIGLTHAPYSRMLNSFWAAGTHLVLSGHTHGGQVCLPGGRPLTNNTDLNLQYSAGLLHWEPTLQSAVKPRNSKGKIIPSETLTSIASRVFGKKLKNTNQTTESAKISAVKITTPPVTASRVLKENISIASSEADYQQAYKILNQLIKETKLLQLPSTASPFTWVNISRGLGTSKYTPFRLFCRPEVSLITVTGIKVN